MIKVLAQSQSFSPDVELLIADVGNFPSKVLAAARPLIMERVSDATVVLEPTLRLRRQAAQDLMDQLWACGLRPAEGAGSAGQLAATERHLADMRRLVFEVPNQGVSR